jgi:hypothetical protein
MMQYVDPDFRRKLDQFNDSQGGPSSVEVCWDPKRNRWTVYAIPVDYGHHPLAKNWVTPKLLRPFLDGSGRQGVFLFTWQSETGEYLPLDDRLFTTLHWADSFSDKHHFEKTIEEPEARREIAGEKERRNLAAVAREYWWNLGIVSNASGKGNWRRAKGIV